MKKGLAIIAASVLLSGLTAYGIVKSQSDKALVNATNNTADSGYFRTVNLQQTDYPDFTYAAESCVDAVVFVKVTIQSRQSQSQQMDPFFQFFFGGSPQAQPREQQGSGSGVIIRSDGYIVTNNHVVDGATKVEVTLTNNKTYEATVVGKDAATDVALLKVDAEGLPTVPFGNSDALRLGEWVIAIGSPYNLRSTITAGIVSAKGRSMSSNGEFKIESFIQTDAAVNPGNSGGALVNKAGELVGINTMIYSQTGSYSGYSFAVPVNIVKKIVADLIDFGSVKRAKLGISMTGVENLDEKLVKDLKLSRPEGVYINEVQKGSAAEKGGLKSGDVIISIDGKKITSAASVQEQVNNYHPGDESTITYSREGKLHDAKIVFQSMEEETGSVDEDGSVAFYGSKLQGISDKTKERLGIKSGVEIVSVGTGKMQAAGAQEGFVILYINDQPVSKPQDVIDLAKKAKRAIYVEGVTANGRPGYFAFGKDE
ncbi:MAG: Do family serine endopeptidase [Bacteroidales bacterium]|nr:Do family serine endopeptidase [Bacteroidales bacterium]